MKNLFIVTATIAAMALPFAANAGWGNNGCGCPCEEAQPRTDECTQVYTFDVCIPDNCLNFELEQPRLDLEIDCPQVQLDIPTPKVHLEVEKPRVDLQFSKPQVEMIVTQPKIDYRVKKPCCSCQVNQPRIDMCVDKAPPCNLHVTPGCATMKCSESHSCPQPRATHNSCGCNGFDY